MSLTHEIDDIQNLQKGIVRFVVEGTPVPKGRARSRIVTARSGQQFVSHYTPKKTTDYEYIIGMYARQAMQGKVPFDCPMIIHVAAYMPIPASWSEKKRKDAIGKPHTVRGDADNILKAVQDGCNSIVYRDDSLIWKLTICKLYATQPRLEVEIIANGH